LRVTAQSDSWHERTLIYAIVAMACYGLSDFIYKQAAAASIPADHFLMAQGWLFCPLVILYALATHTLVLKPAALWGSLAGVFVFLGFYYFIRSLAAGAVSINAAIFRLNFVVTVVLVVVVLREPLTPGKLAGLTLALVATWLLLGAEAKPDRAPGGTTRRSLVQVAIATLAFGTWNFFHTLGLRTVPCPKRSRLRRLSCSRRSPPSWSMLLTVSFERPRRRSNTAPQPQLCCSAPPFACCAAWLAAKRACWCRSHRWVSSSPRCLGYSFCVSVSPSGR